MGRGIRRSPEVVAQYLELVESGIPGCRVSERDDMPPWGTWCDWCDDDPDLAGKYARARSRGIEREEAELLDEARRKPVDSVDAAAQRTRIDALKWHLSKRLPRDFGDRQQVEHSGTIGDGLTEDARARRLAEILRAAAQRAAPPAGDAGAD